MGSGVEFYYSRFLEAGSLTKLHLQLMGMLSMLDYAAIASVQVQSLSEQVSEMTRRSWTLSVKPLFGHILSPINGPSLEVSERLISL